MISEPLRFINNDIWVNRSGGWVPIYGNDKLIRWEESVTETFRIVVPDNVKCNL
jgi:hypothetical protein